jgi:4-amino-4-deoxy-L-arabinose transferase-like glycosyltransferase
VQSDLNTKHNSSFSTWVFDIVGIILLLSIFYAIWIGSHPLFTPDEGRYSEIAREMVATGDFITPRLNGVVFLDKPILYYWLQASAIKLWGLKESALRLWPALIGIVCCLFVYLAGRQLFNRRTALLATLFLATSPLYYGAAHYANLDLEVAAFVSMTLLCFLMAMAKEEKTSTRRTLLLLAYTFAGLATLTKGLIGFVLPGLVMGTWILLLNRWYLLKTLHILTGLLIFAAITLPWYILAQLANPQFFHFFFVIQHFSRFLTMDTFNNQIAFWFYIPIFVA